MAMAEMDMMPEADAPGGPYALAEDLAFAVMVAKGADPAMLDGLPPLSEEMVGPELQAMMEGMGLAEPTDPDADMWAEAEASDAAAIPCAECPDPAACREAGMCALGIV